MDYADLIEEYYQNLSDKYYEDNNIINKREWKVARKLYTTTYNISRNAGYPW